MEMIGPQCPACGAKVKMPKNAPLPPPDAKVKCPTCGTVGELEAFLTAAGSTEEEVIEEAQPITEETTVKSSRPPQRASDTGTRISGSATSLSLPTGLRCSLTVISGPDSGKKMAINRPRVVVGRNAGDFPLSDEEISTEHCAFEISGVTCTVKDLDSRNGTYVEGEKIKRHQLGTVGEVVVGTTTLLFTMTLDEMPQEG